VQAVRKETVELQARVNGMEPTVMDISNRECSFRVGIAIDVPFATDFPDKVDGLGDEDGVEAVCAW